MGTKITSLLVAKKIEISELANKKLAVDAFNTLYQFLTTIRGRDGTQLMDSHGNVTSHLAGLFSRTTKLMQEGLRLSFVFDGEAPKLKQKERERRSMLKEDARQKFKQAEAAEDIEAMRKYAVRSTTLSSQMVVEAKELISALGLPVIQAPSEGEAQAAYMAEKGFVDYIVSQDADALLFKAPFVVKNLAITQRRKKPSQLSYDIIEPEIIGLQENLSALGISHDQLLCLAMLVGTDYNIGGVKGIGPKKALALVKAHPDNLDKIFKEAGWDFDFSWEDVFTLFKNMPTEDCKLAWKDIDEDKVVDILSKKHDFNEERIRASLSKLTKVKKEKSQKGLGDFL
jgi:flap endonuclease-1